MTIGLSPLPPRSAPAALHIPEDVAVYRAKSPCFLDDDLYPEGSIFTWPEEPNLEMEPLNELARTSMIEFLTKIDELGREAAKKAGRSYTSIKDAVENSYALAKEEGKRVRLINGPTKVPLMRGKKKTRAAKVDIDTSAPALSGKGKLAIGKSAVNSVHNEGLI